MAASAEPQPFGQLVQHDRQEEGGEIGPGGTLSRPICTAGVAMSAGAEPQVFGHLVQHDQPEEGGDVTNTRKRKEPHAVSSDHWMLMFRHNDYQRRRRAAMTMIQRPDVRDRLRQPPELHKAINGMSYAQRHAATDIDPLFHAQGPAYFTSYAEDASRNSQGVGALANFTQFPAYYGGGDGTQVRSPPLTPPIATQPHRAMFMQCQGRQRTQEELARKCEQYNWMKLLPVGKESTRKQRDVVVAMGGARRGSTPNYYVAAVGDFTADVHGGDDALAPALPLPLEVSQPLWTGKALVDTIRVLPEVSTMALPPHLRRISGQFLACHLSHCGGAMSPHTWAVHTSHVLNKDAFWRILPVDPYDEHNGAVVIIKADDDESPWKSGGEQWTSDTPLFLTVASPNADHIASVEETATLPLIITAYTGEWRTLVNLPGYFQWKFLNPPV